MPEWTTPADVNLVDLGFMDARSKLLDVAAFLDRVQRVGQQEDFRVKAISKAIEVLHQAEPTRVKDILLLLSDKSSEPIAQAAIQGAIGAVPLE